MTEQKSAEIIAKKFIAKIRIARILVLLALCISLFLLNKITPLQVFPYYILKYIIFCFFALIFRKIYRFYLNKQIYIIFNVIYNDCDPDSYYEIIIVIFRKLFISNRTYNWLGYMYLCCLSVQERYDELIPILKKVPLDSEKDLIKIYYLRLFVSYFFDKKNSAQLKDILQKIITIKADNPKNKRIICEADSLCAYISRTLSYLDGDYEPLKSHALSMLNDLKTTKIHKVSYSYDLADIYYKQCDYVSSKNYCEYVIENGNKLVYVKKAKDLLEECNKKLS